MPSKTKTKRIDRARTQNDYRRGAKSFGELSRFLAEVARPVPDRVDGNRQLRIPQVVVDSKSPEPIVVETTGQHQLNPTGVEISQRIGKERPYLYGRLVERCVESVCGDYSICRMRRVPWGRKRVMFAYNESLQRFAELVAQMRQFAPRFVEALLELRDAENCAP